MPKVHHKKITEVKEIEYPKGCKEINSELSRDELVKRLKVCLSSMKMIILHKIYIPNKAYR